MEKKTEESKMKNAEEEKKAEKPRSRKAEKLKGPRDGLGVRWLTEFVFCFTFVSSFP